MKRHLKSAAQLILLMLAIAATLVVAAGVLAVVDPLKGVPYVGTRGQA